MIAGSFKQSLSENDKTRIRDRRQCLRSKRLLTRGVSAWGNPPHLENCGVPWREKLGRAPSQESHPVANLRHPSCAEYTPLDCLLQNIYTKLRVSTHTVTLVGINLWGCFLKDDTTVCIIVTEYNWLYYDNGIIDYIMICVMS